MLHLLFWSAWVFGFTFIKSFGMPLSSYLGWLVYYIVTLPVFIGHTYLIVYCLIPAFINKRKYLLFTFFFTLLFYGFSVVELIISNEFVFKYLSTGTVAMEHYLAPGNVIISGLGNFYIVLVFLAARSIRTWYLNQENQKTLQRKNLSMEIDHFIARVQPGLLIYSINNIEKIAVNSPERASKAIALISEILSEVMESDKNTYRVFEYEVRLIRKLCSLVEIFKGQRPEVEFFITGDTSEIKLPSLVMFSFVDLILRKFDHTELPEIIIEISGFSMMATIQVILNDPDRMHRDIDDCENVLHQFEKLFPGTINVSFDHTQYGCSVVISTVRMQKVRAQSAYMKDI
jgi:hypothetical protein